MKYFLAGFIIFLTQECFLQESALPTEIVYVNIGSGALVPHKNSMLHLVGGPATKWELDYTLRTHGEKGFHALYKYPYFGFSASYEHMGNSELLGSLVALNVHGSLPLYRAKHPLRIKLAAGLGYLTRPFDLESNHKNNAIGSHLNANFQLRLAKDIALTEGHLLKLGVGASHLSNGSFQQPNLGLNYVHVFLGYGHVLQAKPPEKELISLDYDKSLQVKFITGVGRKENDPPLGRKYTVLPLTVQLEKQFLQKASLFTALDGYFNNAVREQTGTSWQAGLGVGYMQHFDQLRLGFSVGTYLFNPPTKEDLVYSKLIVEYYLTKQLFTQLVLKSHRTKADFFNLTIGWNL